MKLEQRIGRIDRIGQKNNVKVFNFVLADTIEEHVRKILEDKLDIIKNQFGDDKLGDILSTLQEDFNFDQIYFEAIVNDKKKEDKIQEISQEIYEKAKEIIEQENFLIPFTEKDQSLSAQDRKIIEKMPVKIKKFVNKFLAKQGMELKEYSKQDNVYYFKNDFKPDKYKNHFSQVIFAPEEGLKSEEADLFSLKHEFVREAIEHCQKKGFVTAISIEDSRFSGKEGILTYWHLKIENNYDFNKKYYIPIFIEKNYRYNRRISRLFKDMDYLSKGIPSYLPEFVKKEDTYDKLKNEAEKEAENIFLEEQLDWQQKLKQKKQDLQQYYQEKEKAIKKIKIDNIREGRQEKLKQEWEQEEKELKDKKDLYPKLNCEQLAYIKFR